ncbi:FHA domain-containing protein [Vibrio sp. Of7-15]|uniref:FHA domain-containing protein n=1 Tax=Vibrio sp. Of7-15 TaxID=2724879 RepID=UPI001EF1B341|nr:FHA domain-containing protein [Vibrio sp. Of7-15]MCG7497888.1 FHA domain-containing protein [Vibrio sp. Of7-15]
MSSKLLKFNIVDCPEEYTGQKHIDMPEAGGAIGRSSGCPFHLADHNKYISGTHALITTYGGMFYISDVSTNGTFVNGTKILKNQPVALHDGDVILMGRYEITAVIESKLTATNIAADIAPEGNSQDPLASLDNYLPPESPKETGRIEDLFIETEGDDIDTEDPIAHLRFSAREEVSFLEPEKVEEPIVIQNERQIQDDTDSIYSEMDIPNLIPEDWQTSSQPEDITVPNFELSTGPSKTEEIAPSLDDKPADTVIPNSEPVIKHDLNREPDATQQLIPSNWEEVPEPVAEPAPAETYQPSGVRGTEVIPPFTQQQTPLRNAFDKTDSTDTLSQGQYSELVHGFVKSLGGDVGNEKLMTKEFFEQMAGCLKLCLAKFSHDLHNASRLSKTEFDKEQLPEDLIQVMNDLYAQDALMPLELVEQVIEEVELHEVALKEASAQLIYEQSKLCDPILFEENSKNTSRFLSKKKLWQSYTQHFQSNSKGFSDKNQDYFDRRLKEEYKKISKVGNA